MLLLSANKLIHKRKHNFYKFWWTQEFDILKDKSISSNKIWKAAGTSHNVPIYDKHQSHKLAYKLRVKDEMQREQICYYNSTIRKIGIDF